MNVRDTDSDDIASAIWDSGGGAPIRGSSYIFPGDQTENFLVDMTYQVTPPGHSVTKGTGGEWTGSPTFEANGGGAADDRTKFTDSGADFQAYMVGWLLQPDVELPSYLEIVEVDESSGNWVRVKGDADTLVTTGSTYRLHAPPGVDRATGALITGLEEAGSHWLWSGYEYVPPMVGFADPAGQDPGIYGAQSGGNKLGSYHCWNRVYDVHTGRWTTPDPAESPWSNLWAYAGGRPTLGTDPTGLDYSQIDELIEEGCLTEAEISAVKALSKAGWTFIDGDVDGTSETTGESSQVDDQWRVDVKKKEIELDYAHDETGCIQLKVVLNLLVRWKNAGHIKPGKAKKAVQIDQDSYTAIRRYENDESKFTLDDYKIKCCLEGAVTNFIQTAAFLTLSATLRESIKLCLTGMTSPNTASTASLKAACGAALAVLTDGALVGVNMANTIKKCRKD